MNPGIHCRDKKLPAGYTTLFDPHTKNSRGFVDGNENATMIFSILEAATDCQREGLQGGHTSLGG